LFIFETERLKIRRYNLDDCDRFYQLSGSEEVMRYIRPVISKADSDKSLVQNIHQYTLQPNTGRWAMFEKDTDTFVGSFSILVMDTDKNKLHIGYALLPQFWGRGLASEVLKQGINFFFNNHSAGTLYAITEQPNVNSQKVLIKCGFLYHATQKEGEKEVFIYVLNRHENSGNE
jgi:ribosomal-protein-alanine N-acetyltransferase